MARPDLIVTADEAVVERLKSEAAASDKRRARLNLHPGATDPIQEMIIVFCGDCRMPPHKNLGRSESLHVIEGEMEVLLFDEQGNLTKRLAMGPGGAGKPFMYRLQEDHWHTLVPRSDFAVVHEIILGPFEPGNTVSAPWAPAAGPELESYLQGLAPAP